VLTNDNHCYQPDGVEPLEFCVKGTTRSTFIQFVFAAFQHESFITVIPVQRLCVLFHRKYAHSSCTLLLLADCI